MGDTIDYAALADQARAHATIDYAALADQARQQSSTSFPDLEEQVKNNPFKLLQAPFQALGNTASAAHDQLAQKMLSDAAKGQGVSTTDYVKHFLLGAGADASNMVAGALSPKGIGTGIGTAIAPEVMAPVMLTHGALGLAQNAKGAVQGNPESIQGALGAASEMAGAGALGKQVVSGETPIQQVWQKQRGTLRRLSGALQTPQEAAQLPAQGKFAPALNVSNQDIINEASHEGIDLTPAQATREPSARIIQGIGEKTLTPGGPQLQDALEANRFKLGQSVENFARRYDPHALGASPESAGEALQNSAKIAMEVAKDNANIAYKQAGIDQANLAGNVSNLKDFADSKLNVRQPAAAVARPEYQTPAVFSALKDIQGAPERLGANPSIQSMRNLRTEFWEKGNDYSGNIPASAQAIYKQAAQKVDDAIMAAGRGTPFEQSFRDASSQWQQLKSKFDEPGEPLNRILQKSDPKQVVTDILGRKSATDIEKLKAENIDLGPLQSQVVRDIASKGFRANAGNLAGYPDSFLQTLFGPDGARELYVKSEIGRRLNFEVNPSGSGHILIGNGQLGWNPMSWVKGEAAARASMPRNPSSFVSPTRPAPPSLSSLKPGSISIRALLGASTDAQDAQ